MTQQGRNMQERVTIDDKTLFVRLLVISVVFLYFVNLNFSHVPYLLKEALTLSLLIFWFSVIVVQMIGICCNIA
jgi:hypothetical protein